MVQACPFGPRGLADSPRTLQRGDTNRPTRPPRRIRTPNLGNRCVGAGSERVLLCPPTCIFGPHGSDPTVFQLWPSMEVLWSRRPPPVLLLWPHRPTHVLLLWLHRPTHALLFWPRRLSSMNAKVSFYAPASNALALYKQASTSHFLPPALIFHCPPPPAAQHHRSHGRRHRLEGWAPRTASGPWPWERPQPRTTRKR